MVAAGEMKDWRGVLICRRTRPALRCKSVTVAPDGRLILTMQGDGNFARSEVGMIFDTPENAVLVPYSAA